MFVPPTVSTVPVLPALSTQLWAKGLLIDNCNVPLPEKVNVPGRFPTAVSKIAP